MSGRRLADDGKRLDALDVVYHLILYIKGRESEGGWAKDFVGWEGWRMTGSAVTAMDVVSSIKIILYREGVRGRGGSRSPASRGPADDGKRLDALDVLYRSFYINRGGVRGGEWSTSAS